MIDPEPILKARLHWVQMYERTQNANLTCQRCGISKPTLRKWWQRYQEKAKWDCVRKADARISYGLAK